MEANRVVTEWKGDMSFESIVNEHALRMDADESFGGHDTAPRPKPLLLAALAGCTGMDVVSLLKKMKIQYDSFLLDISGELTEEHPKHYHKIHIIYLFQGTDLDLELINKAITLSQEKYCGVSAMLRKAATLSYEIKIN